MRTPNDIRLAENVEEIDLILGGHDHVYEEVKVRRYFISASHLFMERFFTLAFHMKQHYTTVIAHSTIPQYNINPW